MIKVEELSKRYSSFTALDNVSFTVRPGTVTGFLGPNGAGKSTTMRILCGLTPASHGVATTLGVRYGMLPNPGRSVGVLLDASAQHAGRTGREVLGISASLMGLPQTRVDEMLGEVGLTQAEARRRVGTYSLGMRQRLGIAHALMGDPQVLVLDEPANGLDPAGIRWMRGLLRAFAERGGTVLLSSHLLHEIEAIADELVVIGRGRIVAQGSKVDLLGRTGVLVRASDSPALGRALEHARLPFKPSMDGTFIVDAPVEAVGRIALNATLVLTELRPAGTAGLEELFMELTTDVARERSTS